MLLFFGVVQSPNAYSNEDKMTTADTTLVKQIRQDLASDSNLSAFSQNIRIIALNGKVILKGIVGSEDEKKSIYDKVAAESGVSSVESKLKVKSVED